MSTFFTSSGQITSTYFPLPPFGKWHAASHALRFQKSTHFCACCSCTALHTCLYTNATRQLFKISQRSSPLSPSQPEAPCITHPRLVPPSGTLVPPPQSTILLADHSPQATKSCRIPAQTQTMPLNYCIYMTWLLNMSNEWPLPMLLQLQ